MHIFWSQQVHLHDHFDERHDEGEEHNCAHCHVNSHVLLARAALLLLLVGVSGPPPRLRRGITKITSAKLGIFDPLHCPAITALSSAFWLAASPSQSVRMTSYKSSARDLTKVLPLIVLAVAAAFVVLFLSLFSADLDVGLAKRPPALAAKHRRTLCSCRRRVPHAKREQEDSQS